MYLEYDINSRTVERKFMREMNKRKYFRTVTGRINYLLDYGKDSFVIKTSKGEKAIKMKRTVLRKAISFFFFKRTAIRSDFEIYTSFTSALFGVILYCFHHCTSLLRLRNGLYRISLNGTRVFFSGLERDKDILELVKSLGGKYVLFNYKSIVESPNCLNWLETYDLHALIDSGAFNLYNQSKKKGAKQVSLFDEEILNELALEGYAHFINKHKENKRIIGFMPLDCIGDPQRTRDNYCKLLKLTDAKIIPVWQVSDSIESLDQLVAEEHEMIAIGGCVPLLSSRKHLLRTILTNVKNRHPNVCFHALGIADELLIDYRFFSADTTAYINARKWPDSGRKVYLPSGERVEAPNDMSTVEIITQNIKHLLGLENIERQQLSLDF